MRKTYPILFLVLFTAFYGQAQFDIGLEGGITLANVDIQSQLGIDNNQTVQYYYAGLSPRYAFGPKISVIAGVAYVAKGYRFENDPAFDDSKFRYSYVDFSAEIEYKVHKAVGIGVGIYDGFKVGEEQKVGGSKWMSTKDFESIKNADFGLVGALRVYYKKFFLKTSYTHGLKNINNINFTDDNGQPISIELYNRYFQIGIGYRFSVDEK